MNDNITFTLQYSLALQPKMDYNMNKNGPVIVIEDDKDDQEFLSEIFKILAYKNEIVFFKDGNEALAHLNKNEITPFLI